MAPTSEDIRVRYGRVHRRQPTLYVWADLYTVLFLRHQRKTLFCLGTFSPTNLGLPNETSRCIDTRSPFDVHGKISNARL